MKNLFLGIFLGVVLASVGYGSYFLGKNLNLFLPKEIKVVTPTPTFLTEPITENPVDLKTGEIADENMVLIQSEIMQAVSTNNYSDLGNMMSDNVEVILYASECCGRIKKEEAIAQLGYLENAKSPWYFGSENTDISKISQDFPQNYGSPNIVGISSDKMVVSFRTDADGVIDRVIILPNISLLTP